MLFETIRKFTDIKALTPALINRLIQRIEVHKSEKVDGRKRVKLDVYFTAAGLIDITDENELREMMEEIRKSCVRTKKARIRHTSFEIYRILAKLFFRVRAKCSTLFCAIERDGAINTRPEIAERRKQLCL